MKVRVLLSAGHAELGAAVRAVRGADGGWLLVPGATDGLPHTQTLGGDARSFAAFVDFDADEIEDVLPRLDGLRELVDLAGPSSAVLAGTEHVIAAGDDPLQFLVVLAPLASLSREAFHAYWLERHARIVRPDPAAPGRGYRQFHADAEASRRAAARLGLTTRGFEGTASGYVRDVQTFRAALGDAARLAPILEDERNFIDHARSSIGLYARA
jgi:EthD domain-containing protein